MGLMGYCGEVVLPLNFTEIGEYVLSISYLKTIINIDITIASIEQRPVIDLGMLPVQIELLFTVFKKDTMEIITFDKDVNIGSVCDPENITKCYHQFKFKLIHTEN